MARDRGQQDESQGDTDGSRGPGDLSSTKAGAAGAGCRAVRGKLAAFKSGRGGHRQLLFQVTFLFPGESAEKTKEVSSPRLGRGWATNGSVHN